MSDLKPYPSVLQSWGIFGLCLASMLIFIPFNSLFNEKNEPELGLFIYYVLCMSLPFTIAHFLRKKISGVGHYSVAKGKILIYLMCMLAIFGLQLGFTMPISNLLPMPEVIKEMFLELSGYNGIFGFLTIVIAAPIFEELIFRGIILDGLLKRYSPRKSILLSSFLFGIVHLNPWQFISAFVIGCFSGWVYYKTKNLLYPIFIHFVNNLIPFISMYYYTAEELIDMEVEDIFGGRVQSYIGIALALQIAILLIYLLEKKIFKNTTNSISD